MIGECAKVVGNDLTFGNHLIDSLEVRYQQICNKTTVGDAETDGHTAEGAARQETVRDTTNVGARALREKPQSPNNKKIQWTIFQTHTHTHPNNGNV